MIRRAGRSHSSRHATSLWPVLRRPIVIIGVLFGLDYLVWLWSLGGSRGVVGMVAGPLLVILGCALLWLLIKQVLRAVASTTRRRRPPTRDAPRPGGSDRVRYGDTRVATSVTPEGGELPGYDEQTPVKSGSSSAQIAA